MTVGTEEIAGDHVVEFYGDDQGLASTVGCFLAAAGRDGAAAIVIATQEHRRGFAAELQRMRAEGADGILWLDAEHMLASFFHDGRIDAAAFRRVIGGRIREAAGAGRPVRAYGEMVGLLWNAGDVPAAIELETQWNDLQRELGFSLLCAYHSESVTGADQAAALEQICRLHSAVLHPPARNAAVAVPATRFPATPDAPTAARHLVANALRREGYEGRMLTDALLVVTELTTNAVLHAQTPFWITARAGAAGVRISIRDGSSAEPTLRVAHPFQTSGRGLRLVAQMAASWGVEPAGDGKTVWAELSPLPAGDDR